MIYFFMFLRKLISSSEFDDTTLTILEKECLIEDSSILYLYGYVPYFPCISLQILEFEPIIDKLHY